MPSLLDTGDGARALERAVALAHRHLRLDAVYVAELTAEGVECRAVASDQAAFGISVGASMPRANTYCQGLVAGAHIGVPLHYSDGTVYGAVCGLSREPDETLDDRDVDMDELPRYTGVVELGRWRGALTTP